MEKGIVGDLIVEPTSPNTQFVEETIVGETFIKPKKTYEFSYVGNLEGEWSVDKDIPVSLDPNGKSVKSIAKKSLFAIIMGNEGSGMSDMISGLCDSFIYIDMNSKCESLNVGVAASILMYELGSK